VCFLYQEDDRMDSEVQECAASVTSAVCALQKRVMVRVYPDTILYTFCLYKINTSIATICVCVCIECVFVYCMCVRVVCV